MVQAMVTWDATSNCSVQFQSKLSFLPDSSVGPTLSFKVQGTNIQQRTKESGSSAVHMKACQSQWSLVALMNIMAV